MNREPEFSRLNAGTIELTRWGLREVRIGIKGAINIPLEKIGKEPKGRFDRDEEKVLDCADFDCPASAEAAAKLDKLGFENVYDTKAERRIEENPANRRPARKGLVCGP